jgi:hypothetical protein
MTLHGLENGWRGYGPTKISEWEYEENPKYQYTNCRCNPHPNYASCSEDGMANQMFGGRQFTGRTSLQFLALTNYGRILSNFSICSL